MEESGIYEDPGTGGAQPTVEHTGPQGGGAFSESADGGNKADPISTSPNLGNTIAGRTTDDDSGAGLGTVGASRDDAPFPSSPPGRSENNTGGPSTGGTGVTGFEGRELGEGEGSSKGAAAEDVNPGDARSGSITELNTEG